MPPAQRRAAEDFSIGELVRNLAALTVAVQAMNEKIDGLSQQYTPREVHDLALGGVKIDIRRMEETMTTIEGKVDEVERDSARRFRQGVTLIFTAVLAPLIVALVVYVLTALTAAGTPAA